MCATPKFPVSILFVDDEPVNLDILTRYLSSYVDTITVAADGREGYALFLEKRPDIVLTDLIMPGIDGLEMSRMIRGIEPKIPIILLTSSNSVDFLSEAIDIGVTQFLPKPVLKAKLLTAMQRCYDTIDLERRLKKEHERAEENLLRSQKLESLGVLAGGVAHNFNNILTAIIGNVTLATMRLPEDAPALKFMKNIEKSAVRAADIARQMLDYSGKGALMVMRLELSDLVESMREVLMATIPAKINTTFDYSDSECLMEGDPIQLRQVIMALIINAVEAIGEGCEGSIRITTGCITCNEECLAACWIDEGLTGGEYVFLDVADSGCGMDVETISRLFDPFFSTKFTGRGLGMAAVMGIVRWHRGAVHINSIPGEGSRVRILFPVLVTPTER
ncbi:MAG: response regulator [Deltaproteobacteria bacterium]|nr:response regulator [Deltaproteobacteria bacterium]